MKIVTKILCLMVFTSVFGRKTQKPCRLKEFDDGFVCVNQENYCSDELNVPKLNSKQEWMVVTSTKSGQRFDFSFGEFNLQHDNKHATFIQINENIAHHEIVGFGGAITGAVSYILNKLTTNLRECIYKSYYTNDEGLGYSLMRMPIGGCDFDLEPWTYNELPENDWNLSNFTKLHSKDQLRTALIKELVNVTGNIDIKIVGVTWSPPKWMKEKDEWPGKRDNRLKRDYYQTWANYHLKWLDVMHSSEIPIWAISTGNEPNFAHFTPFMGLNWNASDQAIWIAEHLGPTLKHSKHSHVEIHTFDDNRDILESWLTELNSSTADAMKYVSAFGVHGYFDKQSPPSVLDWTKQQFPDKKILYTEMCFGVTGPISSTGPTLGSWSHFEELVDMLMETLMHNANGYFDWNLILDSHGGPNYIHNIVDAMIITNDDFTEFYKQPLFYAAAHFTKFVLPGSKRIEITVSGENDTNLSHIAFLRPDGQVIAIFHNKHDQRSLFLSINVTSGRKISLNLQPKSLNTLIYYT